jgi:sulfate adenylyltransferase subunit 2
MVVDSPSVRAQLDALESESLQIFREVAAGCKNPIMLYSIGKDSSVLLHLLRKAFWPATPPIPLMHIDTGWKFQEMIRFRDAEVARTGVELRVYRNESGVQQGINPITHGASMHTEVMKTQALKQALSQFQFDAAIGGARRDEEKSRAKERIFRTVMHCIVGIHVGNARNYLRSTTPKCGLARACACSHCRIGLN